jgi:hypothetical protein
VSRLALAFVVLSIALVASAQLPSAIDLGDGLSVHPHATWCGASPATAGRCMAWQPTGFVFPAPLVPHLTFARTWARVPASGRILVALSNASGPFVFTGFAVRMMRSDDRGASFVPVTWRWLETAGLLSFTPGTSHGVAAGESGYVWTTDDGGITWIDRGSAAGTAFTELVAGEDETVLIDTSGNVWRMSGTSFARDLVLTDTSAHAALEGDAIVVRTATEEVRIRHGHGLARQRRY